MIAEVAMRRRSDVARTLRRRLRRFEARYEMPSDRLEAAVANGSQRETAEIAQWLITWRAYQRIAPGKSARSR